LAWPRHEGGGNTRSGLALPGQAKKTRNPSGESRKGRLAVLLAQLQPAEGMRLRERLAIRPFLLSRGISQVLSERRNQWSRWRGSAWWGHIAEVPHDFAPTGAGRANESDAPAVRPYRFWTTRQRENPVGAHRRACASS